MSGKLARKQHKVPRFYLRRFADANDQLVAMDMEDGRWYRTSVADAAAERDFYTVDIEGEPSDVAEKALQDIEAAVAPAFARVDQGVWPPDLEVRTGLVNFIAIQMVRGRDWREQIEDAETEEMKNHLAPFISDPRVLRDEVHRLTGQRLSKSQIRGVQQSLESGLLPVDFPVGFLVHKMFERGAGLVDFIAGMTMQLVEAESGFFWTSDTPVYFDGDYDFDYDAHAVKISRFELTMPLDPAHGLVLLVPSARGEVRRSVGEVTVREWNRRLARITERRAYARPDTVDLDKSGGSFKDVRQDDKRKL